MSIFLVTAPFLVWWIFSNLRSREPVVLKTGLAGWAAAYLIFFGASLYHSWLPEKSAVEAYKLLSIGCIFIATLYFCRDKFDVRRLCFALAVLGSLLSLMGLLQILNALPKGWWHRPHFLSSAYKNHNHFAGFLEIVLPSSLGLVFSEKDKAKKPLLVMMCVLMGAALVLTLSRGGILASLAALLVMLLLVMRRGMVNKPVRLFLGFAALVAVMLCLFGLGPIVERLQSIGDLGEEEARFLIWKGAWALIQKHFWFGTGPGTFEYSFLSFRPLGFIGRPQYAHNDYLELWADCGLGALVTALVFYFVIFCRGVKTVLTTESHTRIFIGTGCLASFVSLALHSFVDFNFHIPANWAFFAVAAALLCAMGERKAFSNTLSRKFAAALTTVLFSAAALASVYFGLSSYFLWSKDVSKSLSLDPWNAAAYFEKGLELRPTNPRAALASYDKAARLNPHEPYYDFNRVSLIARSLKPQDIQAAIGLYGKVVAKDPLDPKLCYLAGRDLMELNRSRLPIVDAAGKEMLSRAVNLSPIYAKSAYELVWRHEKNIRAIQAFYRMVPATLGAFVRFLEKHGIWKYHREYYLRLLGIDAEKIAKLSKNTVWGGAGARIFALVDFNSVSGKQVYAGKLFHGYGEIERKTIFNPGHFRLVLRAKGSEAGGGYPYLLVKMDGKTIDSFYLDSDQPVDYETVFETAGGEHTLALRYINDYEGGSPKKARNIWVDSIEVQYPKN